MNNPCIVCFVDGHTEMQDTPLEPTPYATRWISKGRKAHKMTLRCFALATNITPTRFSRIERGIEYPLIGEEKAIKAVFKLLGTPAHD